MRFVTHIKELTLADLRAMAQGRLRDAVSDADFFETLGAHQCFVLSRWIVRADGSGQVVRVARVQYDEAGNMDKPRMLVALAREVREAKRRGVDFGPRFSA